MQITNWSGKATRWLVFAGCVVAMLLMTGCGGSVTKHAAGAPMGTNASNAFAIGETVSVFFSGNESAIPPYDERIKDDGTITMPYVGRVVAVGKSPGALQRELQAKYEVIYTHINVTVKDLERYYYVDGEVVGRGPKLYLGETDIVQAMSAAGGFTEFAKRTHVHLIRNGHTQIINCVKAVDDPRYDVQVYPGDKIYVPRRLW